jgi:hypothetical protein
MLKDLPIYEISIDLENEESTVSFNSLVRDPAHELSFQTFSNMKRFEFNEEERVITGVMISADTPIYRFDDKTLEEYYVVFTKKAIKDMVYDYARRKNFNNLNIEHNGKNVVEDAAMIMLYQVDNEKGFTAPERFKDAKDGSLIGSYKVSPEIFEKAKAGEWTGFSIEGSFMIEETTKSVDEFSLKAISEALADIIRTAKHNK